MSTATEIPRPQCVNVAAARVEDPVVSVKAKSHEPKKNVRKPGMAEPGTLV
ncbi:MAG TPA: hypothetical protein PLD01_16650 [Mycobacterium sp.]|nr:hypothetical protein [Mycobacterium sp.]